ncbi:MAG: glycoside hydrolase family 28 protein [Opitutaceae bacterium]
MAIRFFAAAAALALALPAARPAPPSVALPGWIGKAGAMSRPPETPVYAVGAYGAVAGGRILDTAAIQNAIDACASHGGGTVTFAPGRYLTGALFVKSRVRLHIPKGVTLVATTDEKDYPLLPTRVAGIDMRWPAAVLNVYAQHDAEIDGGGTVDGNGPFWWRKYWALRRAYTPRGLRWAADYDCRRVRLVVVWKSQQVTLSGLNLHRSGFWTVQVTYSDHVTVDGVRIAQNFEMGGIRGPSTDGVDIDSSRYVLVQGCDIDNNDDDICLKAGRTSDGLRVNRPTEYVVIRHNICRRGGGVVAFGSGTAGFIRHVVAYDDLGLGTSEGLRFKSAHNGGGGVEDVLVRDITLLNVPLPFTFTFDWNPGYSYPRIPSGTIRVPRYWKVLATPVEPARRGWPVFRDITIANVRAVGARTILTAAGMARNPLGAVHWENIVAQGGEAGTVRDARDWTMRHVTFTTDGGNPLRLVDCHHVQSPVVAAR